VVKTVLQWLDLLVTFALTLPFLSLPALLALDRNSRTSEIGFERDLRERLLAAGIACIVICGLVWIFSYLYASADPWPDWYD
jgi:hypothetical protein